jgi:hypothetical protein
LKDSERKDNDTKSFTTLFEKGLKAIILEHNAHSFRLKKRKIGYAVVYESCLARVSKIFSSWH